jgi:DHA1 family tetracycline resistance protein-like MFS transporter
MNSIPTSPNPRSAAFIFVFITVALDMLALGVMVPVLPKLVTEFSGGNVAQASVVVGLFGFAWAAMQFFFSPVLGSLSDHFGRRPIIVLSNLGMGLDYLFMAMAPSLWWLFVGRLISGITAATYSTASAYIADVTPPEQRAAKFGLLGAAFGLGFVIGPALGGVLGGIDLRLPFWVAAGLSLANAAYGFFVLPESLPRENRSRFHWRSANPIGAMAFLRRHPLLLGLAIAGFLQRIAHESLPSIFVLNTEYRFAWTTATTGLFLAAIGLASMVVSALLVGPVVKRLGERWALYIGLAFGAIGFTLYGIAPNSMVFMVGLPLLAMWGLCGPALQGLMTRHVEPSEQGQLQGAQASLMGVAGMIGPLLFTQTFAVAIREDGALHFPGAPFVLAALLVAGALTAAWLTLRKT